MLYRFRLEEIKFQFVPKDDRLVSLRRQKRGVSRRPQPRPRAVGNNVVMVVWGTPPGRGASVADSIMTRGANVIWNSYYLMY
jgi:hypothetical protein